MFSFLTALGTRNERMAACIDRVFVPVIHGALSTLLGIIMLGFSEFEFVVKYFFVVMSALIIIGLINGLMLLPVLLSLVGPACEVETSLTHCCLNRTCSDSAARWRQSTAGAATTAKTATPRETEGKRSVLGIREPVGQVLHEHAAAGTQQLSERLKCVISLQGRLSLTTSVPSTRRAPAGSRILKNTTDYPV